MSRPLRPSLAAGYERFVNGDAFRIDGVDFRVRAGRKAEGDLILDWKTANGWAPVTFPQIGLMVDFLYENEHRLYPPEHGYQGGEKVREYLRDAVRLGHDRAAAGLRVEKSFRQMKFGEVA